MTFVLLIDTDGFAGDYSCEMCAYMTGASNRSSSVVYADEFLKENETILGEVVYSDTDFGMAPYSIFPTPGYFNNGFGLHLKKGDEEAGLIHFKKQMKQEFKFDSEYSKEALKLEFEKIDNMEKEDLEKFPAYMTVGIFLSSKDDSLIQFLKNRAYAFAEKNDIKINGFRIDTLKDVNGL